MSLVLIFLAIISLSFFVQNLSGPFNIFGLVRNKLLQNKYVGVFFYELLSCPWCIGFHSGYLVYLLQCTDFDFSKMIIFGLAGSAVNAIFNVLFNKLND